MAKVGKAELSIRPYSVPTSLIRDVRHLIESARAGVARSVNSIHTLLFWDIGNRIHREILGGKRARYGEEIVSTLSAQLAIEYGEGFAEKNLRRMVQFAEVFHDKEIVVTLSRQLGWSHFVALIPLEDDLKRKFYSEMCRIERWSVRTLRDKIQSMLYERTAISRKPEKLIEQELRKLEKKNMLSPDLVFKDPYFLDFLGLKDTFSEKDLESALIRELEKFILELGAGFSFIARQKRISIDKRDYSIDLLF
jgi:predicted nuclease of restriction endonuclease-like (RecB) superfamily